MSTRSAATGSPYPTPPLLVGIVTLSVLSSAALTTGAILGGQAWRRRRLREGLKDEAERDLQDFTSSDPKDSKTPEDNLDDDLDFATGEERASSSRLESTFSTSGISTPARGLTSTHASTPGGGAKANDPLGKEWKRGEYDEELVREQLSRNYSFLGEDGMTRIRRSKVVIVGCGGVGSWAAVMLLRSGIGRLLLIDFDMTTLSSLNRHAAATLEDVGTSKVEATQRYLRKIAPWAEIDVRVGLWEKGERSEAWLDGADWVVDAIDNINTKVDLLSHCHKQGIKVFSSMGAGAKCDPTRIQIADISNTYEDALARSVRTRLRKEGIAGGIPVVYSTEVPSEVKLLPLPEEEFAKGPVTDLTAFDNFRVRVLPVLGPLPCIFGLHIATAIVLDLAGRPLEGPMAIKNRVKTYDRMEKALTKRENRVFADSAQMTRCPIDAADVGYVFEDLYLGRSSLPPYPVLSRPALVRWDPWEPMTTWNCVVMSESEADRHEREVLLPAVRDDAGPAKTPEEAWGVDAARSIARKSRQARVTAEWRRS